MPDFFINGQPVKAEKGQTVMQAAKAAGYFIPGFCWHPQLSVAGNCRICVVEVEGEGAAAGWIEIACNMELMLNGVILSLVTFAYQLGTAVGAVLVFLIFVVATAEIAIAIPIVLLLVRRKHTLDLDAYADLKG